MKIRDYIIGIARMENNLILLLNMDKIMTSEEIIKLEELKKLSRIGESTQQNSQKEITSRKKDGRDNNQITPEEYPAPLKKEQLKSSKNQRKQKQTSSTAKEKTKKRRTKHV